MAVLSDAKCLLFCALLLLISLENVFADSGVCQKTGPCRCEYSNGTAIDLSGATGSGTGSFYSASTVNVSPGNITNIHFFFHPCTNIKFTFNDNVTNQCENSSVCGRTMEFHQTGINSPTYNQTNYNVDSYQNYGSVAMVEFKDRADGVSLVYVIKSITTTVLLVCYSENILIINSDDGKYPVLTFFSPSACAIPYTGGHSAGTTFVIVVLVIVLVYFTVGILIRRFLMGAQGFEIIPNLAFWTELPNLVKDGIQFIRNGFKPPPQTSSSASAAQPPNPNTYDSI